MAGYPPGCASCTEGGSQAQSAWHFYLANGGGEGAHRLHTKAEKIEMTLPDVLEQPVDTAGDAPAASSKKKEKERARSAVRLQTFKELNRPVTAAEKRWALLSLKLVRVLTFHTRSLVWVEWMKSHLPQKIAEFQFPKGAVVACTFGGDPNKLAHLLPTVEEEVAAPDQSEVCSHDRDRSASRTVSRTAAASTSPSRLARIGGSTKKNKKH